LEDQQVRGALLVAGTSSDAGKSVVVAGICRFLARSGVRVAPFKAQNMSLNSTVASDGAEIGRAQAAQAAAAGVAPEAAMNPVLLKPGRNWSSQVVVMGQPLTDANAGSYQDLKPDLFPVVIEALDSLRSRFDVVICEGAGSLAEINLREGDLVNLGLARRAQVPVVIVADIDRGGALAGLFGSLAVLDPEDQALVGGFLLNKFRGDRDILIPGTDRLAALTGRPVLGVLPWLRGLWLDAEDSVALEAPRDEVMSPAAGDTLRIAVVRLPHISNFTDADGLATEPGVAVHFTESPADILAADLVVVPGTKATVDDLAWLRSRGLADALKERSDRGAPLIGLCGGFQMLGKRIVDDVESRIGEVEGLNLFPVETVFVADKLLANRTGVAGAWGGARVAGYEIRHGRVARLGGEAFFQTEDGDEGCVEGAVLGTSWHGVFESDSFRRALLRWVANERSKEWVPGSHSFAQLREARFERLGDLIERYVDTEALARLIENGTSEELPIVDSRLQNAARDKVLTVEKERPPLDGLRIHGDRTAPPGHLDFAVNVTPGGPPEWLRVELEAALDHISGYPDDSAAVRALGERHGRAYSEVLATNGAAEAFWLLAAAVQSQHAVVVHPSFTESEVALRTLNRPVERVFRQPDAFSLDPSAVPDDADLVFVCNPNNPTGTLDQIDELERLAGPDRVVVVDEAFMEFCPGESETLAGRSDLPGVVVIRSITKLWSLPGIRAGYLLGPADLVDRMRAMRQPWPVNKLALAALVACAHHQDEGDELAREVARARDELLAHLRRLPTIRVWPAVANFVLIEARDGPALLEGLLEKGVAVRPAGTFPGLSSNHLRVSVRNSADNRVLLRALEELVG
jgi:adenosylcobyric acid synthase